MARQRTLEEQEERNRQRGRRLQDRRDVRYGSIYRRMMLWAIDDRVNYQESWTMTFVELAKDCEMSRRQAYRTAMELQEMGLIDIQETQANSGKYEFRILWDKLSQMAETTVQEREKNRGRPRKVVPDRHELNEKVVPDRQKLCLTDKSCDSQTNAPYIERTITHSSAPEDIVCAESDEASAPHPRQNGELTEFSFECTGKGPKSWTLPKSKLAEYLDAFPGLDVRGEMLKARQWIRDNPTRRKTAGGMLRFLTSWLNRAQNSGSGGHHNGSIRRSGPQIGPGQRYDPNADRGGF